MSSAEKTFAIVGAGLIGRLLAWRLLEAGYRVTLLDRCLDGSRSAGIVAAAMIAPVSEALDGDMALYTQGKQSLHLWQKWLLALNSQQETQVDFSLSGSVVVTHAQDAQLYRRLLKKMHDHPLISTEDYKAVDSTGLPPSLQHFSQGCRLHSEGHLDNKALFIALLSRIQQLGGTCVEINLPQTKPELLQHSQLQQAECIIDCRGFGAKEALPHLRGVRGEIVRVRAKEVDLSQAVRLMHPRYKLYVVPRPNQEYVIGATQVESASEAPVTVRSSLELLSALYSIHTGFAEAEILHMDARCRPAFDNNLPAIIHSKGYLAINGLHRHGYLLAPPVIEQALATLGISSNTPWPEIVTDHTEGSTHANP